MKWDKLIAKDAALVHLFLNSEVLGPKLPTAWHVHTVTVVFPLGGRHLFFNSNALKNNAKFFVYFFFLKRISRRLTQPLAVTITNFSSTHKTHSCTMDYPEAGSILECISREYLFVQRGIQRCIIWRIIVIQRKEEVNSWESPSVNVMMFLQIGLRHVAKWLLKNEPFFSGTLSNETAEYRACRCLHNFYRLDRFGPSSACPPYGFVCKKDTGILAPNYFWKWSNQSDKERYKGFVNNIHSTGSDYDKSFSTFNALLPKSLKCPHANSCKGGIDSECHQGYKGTFCATCSEGFYFRFSSCLKCPRLIVTVTSSILVIVLFVAVFLVVLWGDSRHAENNRTVADVVMSCFKIVTGFYQVIAGIFSALAKVQWPVILISTEKVLKVFEGNILQFAPLSCIHTSLRLDQLGKFTMIVVMNVSLVGLIFLYLFLKKRYIMNKKDLGEDWKVMEVKSLTKSCYRNIFLLLLTTYPTTSKSIIQILPLPGACVETCFTDDKSDCIYLLRADHSIQCFTPRHNLYWLMASILALYPVGFPLLALFLTYKYRKSQEYEAISFGLRVFFENYKNEFWFWEITEMYRKLILTSLIFLFGSKSLSQIGLTVLTVSVFGVVYTLFRPIKDKFEDRLQTFVLWITFFDVCLGAVYTNWDESQGEGKNDSIFVNVLFMTLNASVLFLAIGKSTCCSVLFNVPFSHLPNKSRKGNLNCGGFFNPQVFSFSAQ